MVKRIVAGRVYDVSYACRDIGYGVEEGIIEAYWTGEIDSWGKLTIVPVDGSAPLYLFRDEILSVAQTNTLSPVIKAALVVGF